MPASSTAATLARLETGRAPPARPAGRRPRAARRELPGLAPVGSATASPLRPGVSGQDHLQGAAAHGRRLPTQNVNQRPQARGGMGGLAMRFAQALAETPSEPDRRGASLALPPQRRCHPLGDHQHRRGWRLVQDRHLHQHLRRRTTRSRPSSWRPSRQPRPVKLNKTKQERLLTLPRMQKASPPTHLIRSKNGDYLRGRVVEDGRPRRSRSRSGSRTRTLPRDRISRIIWLHADELDPSKKPPRRPRASRPACRPSATTASASRSRPSSSPATTLSGKSDVLGDMPRPRRRGGPALDRRRHRSGRRAARRTGSGS